MTELEKPVISNNDQLSDKSEQIFLKEEIINDVLSEIKLIDNKFEENNNIISTDINAENQVEDLDTQNSSTLNIFKSESLEKSIEIDYAESVIHQSSKDNIVKEDSTPASIIINPDANKISSSNLDENNLVSDNKEISVSNLIVSETEKKDPASENIIEKHKDDIVLEEKQNDSSYLKQDAKTLDELNKTDSDIPELIKVENTTIEKQKENIDEVTNLSQENLSEKHDMLSKKVSFEESPNKTETNITKKSDLLKETEPIKMTEPTRKMSTEKPRKDSMKSKSNYLRQFRGKEGFKKFTASQFMEVWNHYDTDGNGYIEDHELDGFLREFVSSINECELGPEVLSDTAMAHFKETFMDAFDENEDGMIDISELAAILPTDENFLLIFRLKNPCESSVEFMKIWRQFDKDCLGYINSTELQSFLKHLLGETKVEDDKLSEYTEIVLNLFDSNRDGQLQLSEMARLMPVKQNFLSKPILKGASCITRRDIDRLFGIYDQNQNGTIEDEELSGLLKDLMELGKKDYTLEDINDMKKVIMDQWDFDKDGQISKSELRMFLTQQCRQDKEAGTGIAYLDSDSDSDW